MDISFISLPSRLIQWSLYYKATYFAYYEEGIIIFVLRPIKLCETFNTNRSRKQSVMYNLTSYPINFEFVVRHHIGHLVI